MRNGAVAVGAEAWLEELPGLVAALTNEWSLELGAAFADATEAFVVAVTLADGTPAVLKVIVPRSPTAAANEIEVLRRAGGEGCVRLLRDDAERGALLLERLGRPLRDLGLPIRRRHEILCATAARVWRPAPGCGLPTGAEKGRWLAEVIAEMWEALDRPCTEQAVDHALGCAARRVDAHDEERSVLLHGDVHQWNTLESVGASAGGFTLVDPDGMVAEPEYDLGVIMREDPLDLMVGDPHERARRLASLTGLDATAIWEWGVVERVSTGLFCLRDGLHPSGDEMLAAADLLARDPSIR